MPAGPRHTASMLLLSLVAMAMGSAVALTIARDARAQSTGGTASAMTPDEYNRDWINSVIADLIYGMAANQGRYDLIFGDGSTVAEPRKAAELRACLEEGIRTSSNPNGANHIEVLGACMVRVDPLQQLSDQSTGRPIDLSWAPESIDSLTVWFVSEAMPALMNEFGPQNEPTFVAAAANLIGGGQIQWCVTAYGLLGVSRSKVENACKSMLLIELIREVASIAAPAPTPEPVVATDPVASPAPTAQPRPTASPSPAPQVCNLSGRWSADTTNWGGRWDLTQQGTSVSGTFPGSSPSYAGQVQGTIEGNRFRGTWRWTGVQSSRGQGEFEYTISDDCRRLTGRMRIGSSGAWFNDSLQRQ